jgi:hypothetical protein
MAGGTELSPPPTYRPPQLRLMMLVPTLFVTVPQVPEAGVVVKLS